MLRTGFPELAGGRRRSSGDEAPAIPDVLDTFTDADNPLSITNGSHVSESGHTWQGHAGSHGISANMGRVTALAGAGTTYGNPINPATLQAGRSDAAVEWTFGVLMLWWFSLYVRYSNLANFFVIVTKNDVTQILRRQAGTDTLLASSASGCGAGDVIRLEAVGPNLTVKRNGVTLFAVSETFLQTDDSFGFGGVDAPETLQHRLDRFTVTAP